MTVNGMSVSEVKDMFLFVGEKVIEKKTLLTKIDSDIGDGDHGVGMSIGFTEVKKKIKNEDFDSLNSLFKAIGMSMISSMGGASGVLFGTLFVGGVKEKELMTNLNVENLVSIFDSSLQAVKDKGKAKVKDKTMIDSLEPAVIGMKEYLLEGNSNILECLNIAERDSRKGMEKTKEYIAKFGRSKTLGERAIGYPDAGATTIWIIFNSMYEWVGGLVTNE